MPLTLAMNKRRIKTTVRDFCLSFKEKLIDVAATLALLLVLICDNLINKRNPYFCSYVNTDRKYGSLWAGYYHQIIACDTNIERELITASTIKSLCLLKWTRAGVVEFVRIATCADVLAYPRRFANKKLVYEIH